MRHVCSFIDEGEDIISQYVRCGDGLPRVGVIAGWEDVEALAQGAAYQVGIAHLEIHQELGFVESTVRLMAHTVSMHSVISSSPQVLELCRHLNITEIDSSN